MSTSRLPGDGSIYLWAREPDTSATRHFGITKLVPKFKTNHRWSCVSSELSWVEVSRLFLDHGTRVEVSRTTFLASKCLEIGAEVSQSVLMPKCLMAEVSGNHTDTGTSYLIFSYLIFSTSNYCIIIMLVLNCHFCLVCFCIWAPVIMSPLRRHIFVCFMAKSAFMGGGGWGVSAVAP